MSKTTKSVRPVPRPEYEFFGPIGTTFLTFFLPPLIYTIVFLCNDKSGCPVPSLLSPSTLTFDLLKRETGWQGFAALFSLKGFLFTLGYYAVNLVLWTILPAEEHLGTELRNGTRLKYRLNSLSTFMTILAAAAAGTYLHGPDFFLWTFLWDNYIQVLTASLVIATSLTTYCYIDSFNVKPGNPEFRELAAGGVTGNLPYDWFIGRELNPRIRIPLIGEVDIKTFMELRPGMMLWALLDLTFIAHQYKTFGTITPSILLSTGFQLLYITDSLVMEPAVLTTMDITTDGFGFMLSFGDVVWVPFIYSLQPRYLAMNPVQLNPFTILAITVMGFIGYYVFRSSNNEKNRFRTNPNDPRISHLEFITTARGSKLLVSGWWGRARHINYLGDWLLSWSYSLPTGLAGFVVLTRPDGSVGPVVTDAVRGWGILVAYFYMIYFAVLLVHRERRDEEKCHKKYGADWEKYKQRVPWRIIPYVY